MTRTLGSFWRSVRGWLPGVIISLTALILLFRMTSWQDLTLAFSAVKPINLLGAILLTLLSLAAKTLAWKTLLANRPTFIQTFFILNEGYLLNNIFPLRAGEFGRAIFMGQASGFGTFHVLSTIVIERAFDVAVAACLLLGSLPFALGADWARPLAVTSLVLVAAGFAVLFFIARNPILINRLAGSLGSRWSLFNRLVVPQIRSFVDGLATLTRPSEFFWVAATLVVCWVFWLGTYYLMLLSIAPQAPFWWTMFITGVIAAGLAVPSAPAGLGVYEAATVGALAILGVTQGAIGFAVMAHILQITITGILGLIGLNREGRSLSKVFSQIMMRKDTA